ncbi:MAG: hypothetical protein AAFQ61_04300 [Cyanobacteria bacterium J06626_23]
MQQYTISTHGLTLEQQFQLTKAAGQLEAVPPQQLRALLLDLLRENMVQRNVIAEQAKAGNVPSLAGVLGQMG